MYSEFFSIEDGVIGLRVIKDSTVSARGSGQPLSGGKCWTLHYGTESKTYQYVVGHCYDDWFYPYRHDRSDPFEDVLPYWLTPYHRARVRSLLTRFHELVRSDPAALRTMGMAAFMKLEKLLAPTARTRR